MRRRSAWLPALVGVLVLAGCSDDAEPSDDAESSDTEGPHFYGASADTETPVASEDVDLYGQWQLENAQLGEDRFSIPSDVNFDLTVRDVDADEPGPAPRGTTALPHAPSCPWSPMSTATPCRSHLVMNPFPYLNVSSRAVPRPVRSRDYFKALFAVDHAERTSNTLVLTGPGVVLTYRRVQELMDDKFVLRPTGVGRLRLGMSSEQVRETGIARAVQGSRHDGWGQGCKVVLRPGAVGRRTWRNDRRCRPGARSRDVVRDTANGDSRRHSDWFDSR